MGSFLKSDNSEKKGCYAGKPKHLKKKDKLEKQKLRAREKFECSVPDFCLAVKK